MKGTVFHLFIFSILIFFNTALAQVPKVEVQYLRGQAWLVVSQLPTQKTEWLVMNAWGKPIHQLVLPAGPSPAYFDLSTWSYGFYGYRWYTRELFGTGHFGLMPWSGAPSPLLKPE